MDKFERLLKSVGKLTESNNHTEARIEIAKYFGFNKSLEKLQDLQKRGDSLGFMSMEMIRERMEITDYMLERIPNEIKQLLYDKL